MKVKLLKRIRKQYSIVYYPHEMRHEIKHPHSDVSLWSLYMTEDFTIEYNKSYNEALNNLMEIVRCVYYKYTRKYKLSKINHKVWHND